MISCSGLVRSGLLNRGHETKSRSATAELYVLSRAITRHDNAQRSLPLEDSTEFLQCVRGMYVLNLVLPARRIIDD